MVSLAQPRNRLEDRGGKNNKMFRKVWKTVETNTREIRIAETEGGRGKRESRKEVRRKEEEEEVKERKNSRSEKGSRRMGNIG